MTLNLRLCLMATLAFAQFTIQGSLFAEESAVARDRAIQGEYAGKLEGEVQWGVQIVALGQGKFRGIGLMGGLPGDGWQRGDEVHTAEGAWSGDKVVLQNDHVRVTAIDEVLSLYDANGRLMGKLKKVSRQSPTLGAKPPKNAIILFDGQNADAWQDVKVVDFENSKVLQATGCSTQQTFGDHDLHIEFRSPFVPEARGQGRGNSGIYVQNRYEIQILDSLGLPGEDSDCGGIYSVQKPKVNMCYPPESWQTYDIQFTAARFDDTGKKTNNARITVKHNGVVIHDNLELPSETPAGDPEGADKGRLFLQDHGNPVLFRNIWAVHRAGNN
ncbi:MAG: DUF1080 domain-containing protein [Planctomycetota bacterium]|nr:DUF1080 domain-containing protein [Planctomycetota bacterium]MDA1178521.1 DUF1080 domain-containing protein [Planctomycetota bacterium]